MTREKENKEKSDSLRQLITLLYSHLSWSRKAQFFFIFLLMIVSSFAEILSIGAVLPFLSVLVTPQVVYENELAKPFINLLDLSSPDQLLLPLTILFGVAAIFSGIMRITSLWVQTRVGHFVGADLSIDIYRRTLYQDYSTHISRNSSDLIAGIATKTTNTVYYIVLPCLNILSAFFILTLFLFALALVEPSIAIGTLFSLGFIYLIIMLVSKRKLANYGETVSSKQNQVIKNLQEGLGGIRDVIIENAQETYVETYKKADIPLRRALANIQIISGSPRFGIEAIAMVIVAVIALSLSGRPEGLTSAIPILGALALGAQRVLPILQLSYSSWSAIRGGEAVLIDVLDLLEQPLPETEFISTKDLNFNNDLRLCNVSFKYVDKGPNVLEDISLTIKKGSMVGFIGETGSGKTTLLDITMGLLNPNSGCLKVDGQIIDEKNIRSWQNQLAHVPQEIFLADTTVSENIAFGVTSDQIDQDRVKKAANKSLIENKINSLKNKYNTLVGERGASLSGGQKQRLGIARALYKDAGVLILDEATSALDIETEKEVLNSIRNLDESITILMVTHRLDTLRYCSKIIELKDGKIHREGSFNEIVKNLI